MFPQIEIDDIEKEQEEVIQEGKIRIGKTFLVDFKEKKFLKKNGKLIKTKDNRHVRMWIEKVLITKKYKYKIYETYGMGYYDLIIGRRFPTGFLYAELRREIEETMFTHPLIKQIENFKADLLRHSLHVEYDVILTDGSKFRWEVYL